MQNRAGTPLPVPDHIYNSTWWEPDQRSIDVFTDVGWAAVVNVLDPAQYRGVAGVYVLHVEHPVPDYATDRGQLASLPDVYDDGSPRLALGSDGLPGDVAGQDARESTNASTKNDISSARRAVEKTISLATAGLAHGMSKSSKTGCSANLKPDLKDL